MPTERDWYVALRDLATGHDITRREDGTPRVQAVQQRHTIQHCADQWERALTEPSTSRMTKQGFYGPYHKWEWADSGLTLATDYAMIPA